MKHSAYPILSMHIHVCPASFCLCYNDRVCVKYKPVLSQKTLSVWYRGVFSWWCLGSVTYQKLLVWLILIRWSLSYAIICLEFNSSIPFTSAGALGCRFGLDIASKRIMHYLYGLNIMIVINICTVYHRYMYLGHCRLLRITVDGNEVTMWY